MQTYPNNIFLVGLMGAGKSTVGKQLADALSYDFYDSDAEIEKQTGARIAWIFDKEGEAGFRERETKAVNTLTKKKGIVLATGGGAVLSEKNRNYLKNRGCVIYLKASEKVLYKRTAKDKSRPLLQTKNRMQVIKDLLAARESLYMQTADIVVETQDASVKDMVKHILERLAE